MLRIKKCEKFVIRGMLLKAAWTLAGLLLYLLFCSPALLVLELWTHH